MAIRWIEAEHLNQAADAVLETCLFRPEEIADGSQQFEDLIHSLLRLYASGKPRSDIGEMIVAEIDEYLHPMIRQKADDIADAEREDEYMRDFFARGY